MPKLLNFRMNYVRISTDTHTERYVLNMSALTTEELLFLISILVDHDIIPYLNDENENRSLFFLRHFFCHFAMYAKQKLQ